MNRKVIVSKGGRRFAGREDKALLEVARRQQCLIAGRTAMLEKWTGVYPNKQLVAYEVRHVCSNGKSEPHHPVTKARGGYDQDTVPLCHDAHRELHDIGTKAFNARWKVAIPVRASELAG
jgi:hypothetical protein